MQRRLDSVLGNSQKLDGGAMFGNAPRALWAKWSPPDDQNRIDLACRALLVREDDGAGGQRRILCETGIGAFFEPKLRERFGVQEERHVLLDNLRALGVEPESIDVVVLSHLHFDHAGGLLSAWREGEGPSLVFPHARFVVGREAWQRALHPHPRDRASFIPELQTLLEASGRLEIVDGDRSDTLGPAYRLHRSDGHTPGMLLVEVPGENGPVVFAADLVPGVPWVRRAITMGYDRFPERLIDEKTALLEDLCNRNGRLFFTHDPGCALARLEKDDKGHVVARECSGELRGLVA
jgi:glyoxylase-like metal-dependent hydrolase (beta-lactamase superfamily II)